MAIRTNRAFWGDAWKVTTDPVETIMAKLLIILAILAMTVPVMWVINIYGFRWFNLLFFFAGGTAILITFYNIRILAAAFGLGFLAAGLSDQDKTQGSLQGLKILYRVVGAALFGFWFVAGLLTVHPWHQSWGAFWALMIAVCFYMAMSVAFGINTRKWTIRVCTTYTVILAGWALWTTVPNSFKGEVFNPKTGDALYMMEPDGSAVYTDRKAEDCVPGCYSPYTGAKLVPVTPEAAARHGLSNLLADSGKPEVEAMLGRGTVLAPVSSWSSPPIRLPCHLTIHWWGDDMTGDRFKVQYFDQNGQKKDYTGRQKARGVQFMSTSGKDEVVHYKLVAAPPGNCH